MTNAQNDKPSDGQSAAFGLAPCWAEAALCDAGFMTRTVGPVHPRCSALLGGWESPMQYGKPYRWDLVLADCKAAFPSRFPADARPIAMQAGVTCPQSPAVRCIWPDCLAIGCPIAKPNTTLSHAGTSERKQDGAATGVGSGNS